MATVYRIRKRFNNISFDKKKLICLQDFEKLKEDKDEAMSFKWSFDCKDQTATFETFKELYENSLFQAINPDFDDLSVTISPEKYAYPITFSIQKNSEGLYDASLYGQTEDINVKQKLEDFTENLIANEFPIITTENIKKEQVNYLSENMTAKNLQNKEIPKIHEDYLKISKSKIEYSDKLKSNISSYILNKEDFLDLITIIFQNFPEEDLPKIEIELKPKDHHKEKNARLKTVKYTSVKDFLQEENIILNINKYDVDINIVSKICKIMLYLNQGFFIEDNLSIYGENETFCQGKYYAITNFFKTKKPWYNFIYHRTFSFISIYLLFVAISILNEILKFSIPTHHKFLFIINTFSIAIVLFIFTLKLLSLIPPKRKIILRNTKKQILQNPLLQQIISGSFTTIFGGIIVLYISKIIK